MFAARIFRMKSMVPRGRQRRFPIRNGRGIGSQDGFTLIEIIVSLILVGILASMGGMAIVQAVQGYMTTRENSAVTQKSQLAMSRITREIIEMINIPSGATATATALPMNNIIGNRTIGLDGGAVKIALGANSVSAGDDILIDNVGAFTLTYYSRDPSSGAVVTASTWPATNDITTLTTIDINLQINRTGGSVLTFANRVAPRNNKNQGGAAPSMAPPSAPSYGFGCFVATAAYGDPSHPMVQILRDFRDRYLLTWKGGRWFVEQYYEHGPAAADLIRNRPLAMWAVRGLLAPVIALTFFLLYAPLALPFLLVVSLILTSALFSAARRGAIPLRSSVFHARGSILIALIVTMVIMATLSAAMLPMFSASYMNQVYADQGRKTYSLAESGFRYAAGQFLNAGTAGTAQDTAMTAMNNKTCNLLNNAGSFTTRVYPYWFKTQVTAAGATTLVTQVYGTIPSEFDGPFSGGQIRVGNIYSSYTSGNGSGTAITFSGLSPALPATAAGLDVQLVTQPGSAQSLSKGGSLTLGTGYNVFPLLNGNFILNGVGFNYQKRTGATLYNVTKSNGNMNAAWTSAESVTTAMNVILDKFLRLSSTGTLGNATREVIYNVPIGYLAGGGDFAKQKFHDSFDSGAYWYTNANESMGTQSVSGGAMNVTATVDPSGSASGLGNFLRALTGWTSSGKWAFTAFNWGNTNTNLAQAWMDSQGCLSYDIQVKVNTSQLYFMGGLGFRMRNNSTGEDLYNYGVSIVRGRQRNASIFGGWVNDWLGTDVDGIATALESLLFVGTMEGGSSGFGGYRYSQPAIVFWQRNGPASGTGSFKVLAYRLLTTADAIVTGTAPALRLKPWSSLMVRVIEGYSLSFTAGRNDTATPARHLKYGDSISNAAGTKTARIIGTPIVESGSWAGTNAAGTLILTNVTGGAFAGEAIRLDGGDAAVNYAMAGTQAATKANFIMVYYSDDKTPVAGNIVQADNTRIGNQRNGADFLLDKVWPPDDWTDRALGLPTATPPGNDYFSLVGGPTVAIQWTNLDTTTDGYGYSASFVNADSSTDLYRAVIKTDALVTGTWTSSSVATNFSGDSIALMTSGSSVSASTPFSYDDFAIQLDQKSGTGFLPPIQQ